jgi:hypothetical protein
MATTLPIRSLMLALTAGTLLISAPAFALDAHSEEAVAEPADAVIDAAIGAAAEFTVGDTLLKAQMPCAEPTDGPPGPDGLQTTICIMGERMFIFAASAGVSPDAPGPMAADCDAAFEEVQSSRDTDFIEEVEVDGHRVMRATRNPASGYGTMQAVQFAPDALVYLIAMSRPNAEQALTETEKQEMRDFVASLEINP